MYGHAWSSQRCISHAAPTLQQAAANAWEKGVRQSRSCIRWDVLAR